jgi:hypothetical protein
VSLSYFFEGEIDFDDESPEAYMFEEGSVF